MRQQNPFLISLLFVAFVSSCNDGSREGNNGNNNQNNNQNSNVCGNGVAEGSEFCDGEDLRGNTCQTVGNFSGGQLFCTPTCQWNTSHCETACQDQCTEGAQECVNADTARRVCVRQEDGCTAWNVIACPPSYPYCKKEGEETVCSFQCANNCTLDDRHCTSSGTGVETCIQDEFGCLRWRTDSCPSGMVCRVDENGYVGCFNDCYAECWEESMHCENNRIVGCVFTTPECSKITEFADCTATGQVCRLDENMAPACLPPSAGDTCALAEEIQVPAVIEGFDPAAQFSDQIQFTNCGWTYGIERIFRIHLEAGEAIVLQAFLSDADVSWYAFAPCTEIPASCEAVANVNPRNSETMEFTAPYTGDFYFALEFEGYVGPQDYSIRVFHPSATEEDCSDQFDNDLNFFADCADPACYGVDGCPVPFFSEDFEVWPPAGWTIVNGGYPAFTWFSSADDGMGRTLAPASGLWALVDPAATGSMVAFYESLVSPSVDCSAFSHVGLQFVHEFQDAGSGDSASVEISVDGGSVWYPVRVYASDWDSSPFGGEVQRFDISALAAGRPNVRLRFVYRSNFYSQYWQVDSIRFFGN